MIYPNAKQPGLDETVFENPPAEYRGAPFWSWNCQVTKELIETQIPAFRAMGMGSVTVHPRVGLDLPYMGPEFLDRVRDACQTAKENGMKVVLYDEDNFPSGNAGGLVTKNPAFRSRYLLLTASKRTDCLENRKAFTEAVESGQEPAGYYICSYQITLREDGTLERYTRLTTPQDGDDIRHLYLLVDHWKDDNIPYVDTLNPEAVREFIRITYEAYEKALGSDFGTTAFAIFTDEPRIHNRNLIPEPFYKGDTTLAYTDSFDDSFKAVYGRAFTDILPEIVWELPDGKPNTWRYAYNRHLTECFAKSYSDQIGDWCEKHGIAFTGHLLSERTLFQQTYRLGEAMRHYKNYQIPGIDILCGDLEYTTAKQAASVARQYGREGVTSELYGVTNWDYPFKGYKLQGDWQAALGVTLRVHHLAYMSMKGEGKRDWPGSIFYQSPWYREFASLEDHFARLNTVLTRGQAKVRIGVIHPVESYWLELGNNAQTKALRDQRDADFEELTKWLLFSGLDFDFISEALLSDLAPKAGTAAQGKDKFTVGCQAYDVVILPDLKTIRKETRERLETFANAGGTILALEAIPALVDGTVSTALSTFSCKTVPFKKQAVLSALEPFREISIHTPAGDLSTDLLTQLRTDGDREWLFICHAEGKVGREDDEERRMIRVQGIWNPVMYDTLTGRKEDIPATVEKDCTCFALTFFAESSALICLEPGKPALAYHADFTGTYAIVPQRERRNQYVQPLKTIASASLSEPNVLLLDTPSWKLDDRQWNPAENCLKAAQKVRRMLRLSDMQPYRQKDTDPRAELSLRYIVHAETDSEQIRKLEQEGKTLLLPEVRNRCPNGQPVLALEPEDGLSILWNGEPVSCAQDTGYFVDSAIRCFPLPDLMRGDNILEIRYPYGAKSFIEPCYLLGDFGVRLSGTEAVLTPPLDHLTFAETADQELPFYTGNLTYNFRFATDRTEEWILEVPHFASAVLHITADGRDCGSLAYSPHRISLGKLHEGGHRLSITVFGNRHNVFGPLHNADPNYKWYGPQSFRTEGYAWTDSYRLHPLGLTDCPQITPANPTPWYY